MIKNKCSVIIPWIVTMIVIFNADTIVCIGIRIITTEIMITIDGNFRKEAALVITEIIIAGAIPKYLFYLFK